MVNSEVSLKPLLATNVPMIFTLLVSINFTETGHCFVYLRDILEEVAELTGLALQEDSCFDYWVVDDAATSSTHSTPCLASCRYDQLAAFTAATDSSDKVLGLTGFVLDIDSLPAEATITLRAYEHIKARLPFVNITTRPQGRVDAPVPSGAPSASKHDLLVREKREASPSDRISGNLRPNTEPDSTDDKLVNSEDHANLPTYSEGRTTMTDLMLEAYPQEIEGGYHMQLTDGWITRSSVSYLVASVLPQGTDPHAEKTQRISKMATPTADHVSLMGDLYGKVDATNWGVARERLQNVLKGEGRLKHVTGVLDVGPEPLQSEFTRLEGDNRVDDVATYRNQLRLYRQDVDALDQALAQARNTLIVCLGESTFARVKANATHDLWAALDKDLGRASDDFMRSAKLDALFLCEPFVDGEALDPWLANFNRLFEDLVAAHVSRDKAYQRARIDGTSFTQSDFDKWVPPPALSEGVRMDLLKARMPRNLVTVIDSIGTLPSLEQVEGAIRRAALSSSRQIEPIAEALAARVQSRSQPASGRPRAASRVPGLKERWPHGISHAGRLKLGRMQCRRCYEQGHLGDECTVPSAEVSRRRIAVLAKHNITIGAADVMALVAVDRAPEAQLEDEAYKGYFVVGVPIGDDDTALYLSDIPRYLLDSGATRHMTTRRDLLIDFKPFTTERVRVVGAFNSSAMATGTGTLRFGVDEASIELHDVLLVPGLSAELVSLAGLMKDGYELSNECDAAGKHTGIAISSATSRLSFALDRNHYVLQASSHPPPRADHLALTATTLPTDVVLWHQRLGHPSWGRLVELVRSGQIPLDVAAVTPDQIRLLDQCDACCAGKTVSSPNREPASHPADAPFSRVFADVWGPSPVPALSGARYLCGITDEFSRFRWARSIRLKSDSSAVLQDFVAMSKTQYGGQGVTTLRTDRGGEFVNHRLRDWLAARGIFHELSTAYEHGQMGVQERSWRTIFNSVRAWLHRSGLPPALWDEAAHAAIYVINLLPSSPLQQRTPDSVLHEPSDPVTDTRRPRLDRVKTWGCAAHVPLAPEQRPNKLAPQSRLCYFVGYSSQSKAWRFFDPVRNKVFESSQARFFEDRFFPAAVSPAMPAIPVAVGLSYPPAPLGIGSAAAPPVAEAPAVAPAAAAPPPVPPALAFSNPGPANTPPDGDRSTRTRRPPDYLGFAHAAQHWEFADHAAIQFDDFDEGDPDTQMYSFEEVSALLAKIDSDDTPSVQAALAGPFRDYWLAAMLVEEGALAAKNAFSKPV
ncbi:BQ5605_C006g04024 [Microbotryum silenes-dioicae]|uniref:BQ5605_C006g04024 protein n=1 Tax=Microbotryum silenes-dioicae TaxID=796604 RepID=A0A2X0M9X9_9BASI|nr:BQ5605_C006g04024 [Microbotryum silenes-dioicae]